MRVSFLNRVMGGGAVLFAALLMCGTTDAQVQVAACSGTERIYLVLGTSVEVRNSLNVGVLSLVNASTWRSAEFQPVTVAGFDTLQGLAFPVDETDGAFFFGLAIERHSGLSNDQGERATIVFTCTEAVGQASASDANLFGNAVVGLLESSGLSLMTFEDVSRRFPDAAEAVLPRACADWGCHATEARGDTVNTVPPTPDVEVTDPGNEGRDTPGAIITGETTIWSRTTDAEFVKKSLPLVLSSGTAVGVVEITGRRMTALGGEFMEFALNVTNNSDCPLDLAWRFMPIGEGTIFGATAFPIAVGAQSAWSHNALVDVESLSSGILGADWGVTMAECGAGIVDVASFGEVEFQLQGLNTSSCGLQLAMTFIIGDSDSRYRSPPVEMPLTRRGWMESYRTTVHLGSIGGPLTAEWTGTTQGCPGGLDQSVSGSLVLWDEGPPARLRERAIIRSFEGKSLGYIILTIEGGTAASTGDAELGVGQVDPSNDSEAVEFTPLLERSKWARSAPYAPEL